MAKTKGGLEVGSVRILAVLVALLSITMAGLLPKLQSQAIAIAGVGIALVLLTELGYNRLRAFNFKKADTSEIVSLGVVVGLILVSLTNLLPFNLPSFLVSATQVFFVLAAIMMVTEAFRK